MMNKAKIYPWLFAHRHPIFLIGLICFFILPEIIEKVLQIHIPFPILISALIVSSMMLIHTSRKSRLASFLLILALIIFVFIWSNFESNPHFIKIAFVLLFIYFSFISFYLYKDLMSSQLVTPPVVIGAFSGYFMIGVLFFFVFGFLDSFFPDTTSADLSSMGGIQDTFYFSFVTLTTIGYGDITPTSAIGQNFAILEGLVGQFYIAIIVAIIVGKFMSKDNKN